MGIETFLEKNFIDPKIKKFTDSHLKKATLRNFQCGKCKKLFDHDELIAIKYSNKQILRCKDCFKAYRPRR